MSAERRESVRLRAEVRCEYGRLPDFALDPADFHVEHIVARQHDGTDEPANLAWACAFCDLRKGPNLAGLDPDTGLLTPLCHPRRELWSEHFAWDGARVAGRTPTGRTTVWLLKLNAPALVALRDALSHEGRF